MRRLVVWAAVLASAAAAPGPSWRTLWGLKRGGAGASQKLEGLTQEDPQCKFVIVTGGVISGIGKGVTASSLGLLLKMMRFRPTSIKIDPYLNVDAGTMSPFEHGEVFVLDDGGETDLDLGNYERFLDVRLTNDSNLTTGKVYQHVIEKERRGEYLGKTVQVVPHITNAIQDWILRVARQPVDGSDKPPNVCVIELGGTLGDIESMPFVEALRQLQDRVGYKNCCFLHVSMVPKIGSEQKTKPTQHSVRQMRALGLIPDFLICRSPEPLAEETTDKIAMFCQVPPEHVISVHDVSNIFRVPLLLMDQRLHTLVAQRLRLECMADRPLDMDQKFLKRWRSIADTVDDPNLPPVRIAVVGKYTGLRDSYLSIHKALQHAAIATRQRLEAEYLDSSEPDLLERLESEDFHGILVPGGFGGRGLDGKVAAIRWARENGVPFLGICLGMQAAVIEFARNVLNKKGANSAEFKKSEGGKDDVVIFMPEGDRFRMGGTMRLGARTTIVSANSSAFSLYGGRGDSPIEVDERHRHRYEVNPDMVGEFESRGLRFVGRDASGRRMEIIELADYAPQNLRAGGRPHPFFVGVQFHPEFKSRPTAPAPLFVGLIKAAGKRREAHAHTHAQAV